MKIILKFDYYSRCIYVPDGYVKDSLALQKEFFLWLYDRPENYAVSSRNVFSLSYNENDFVQFINETLLCNSNERAYLYPHKMTKNAEGQVLKF